MKLTTVHQVLIVGAISLGVVYALRSLVMYSRTGAAVELGMGAAGAVLAVGLGFYLRKFRSKVRETEEAS